MSTSNELVPHWKSCNTILTINHTLVIAGFNRDRILYFNNRILDVTLSGTPDFSVNRILSFFKDILG